MDERWLLSRRALLGGLGALGASALLPRRFARAQNNPAIPPRLIIVHVPEGMWSGAPRPSAGGQLDSERDVRREAAVPSR